MEGRKAQCGNNDYEWVNFQSKTFMSKFYSCGRNVQGQEPKSVFFSGCYWSSVAFPALLDRWQTEKKNCRFSTPDREEERERKKNFIGSELQRNHGLWKNWPALYAWLIPIFQFPSPWERKLAKAPEGKTRCPPTSARKISANQRGGYMVLPPDTQVSGTFVHSFIAGKKGACTGFSPGVPGKFFPVPSIFYAFKCTHSP